MCSRKQKISTWSFRSVSSPSSQFLKNKFSENWFIFQLTVFKSFEMYCKRDSSFKWVTPTCVQSTWVVSGVWRTEFGGQTCQLELQQILHIAFKVNPAIHINTVNVNVFIVDIIKRTNYYFVFLIVYQLLLILILFVNFKI